MPEVLKEGYLDVYDRIQLEVVSTTRFHENSDLSTTYLGRSDRAKCDKLKAEESFPISEQGYTLGKLLDGTECQLLLVLYNILLPINLYIGNNTTKCHSKSMSDNGEGYFIRKFLHFLR